MIGSWKRPEPGDKCPYCNGAGRSYTGSRNPWDPVRVEVHKCTRCKGTGVVQSKASSGNSRKAG